MALLKCKNCGYLISPKAEACPNCHHSYSIKGLNGTWRMIFLLSCILVIFGAISIPIDTNISNIYRDRDTTRVDDVLFLTSVAYNIGLFFVVYVIGKTFKTRKTQISVIALWSASFVIFVIRRVLDAVYTYLNDIPMSLYLLLPMLLHGLYITLTVMRVIAFLMMTRQIQKQMKGCIYMLLFVQLMVLFVALITDNVDGSSSFMGLNALICIIAIIRLLYISYKK